MGSTTPTTPNAGVSAEGSIGAVTLLATLSTLPFQDSFGPERP
jgi:hypothetical protein